MEIKIEFPGGSRVTASFGQFTVHTDQPKENGEGSAPTPFELFLASLATCAGYYVLGFCRSRHISTEGIRLTQRVERDPATAMVRKVLVDIYLPPEFPKEYTSAVVRAAEACLVKKHLEHPPAFKVTALPSSGTATQQ
jgi:putative redox protein